MTLTTTAPITFPLISSQPPLCQARLACSGCAAAHTCTAPAAVRLSLLCSEAGCACAPEVTLVCARHGAMAVEQFGTARTRRRPL